MEASREMTLKEYVNVLPDIHLAHKQYTDLVAKLKVAVEALELINNDGYNPEYDREGHFKSDKTARMALEKIKAE